MTALQRGWTVPAAQMVLRDCLPMAPQRCRPLNHHRAAAMIARG